MWDFLNDPEMVAACEMAAEMAASRWDGVTYDDAVQDAAIWLAEHPNAQRDWHAGHYPEVKYLARDIYTDGLRYDCIREGYKGMTNIPHDGPRPIPATRGLFKTNE